jgi:hypothetical protein
LFTESKETPMSEYQSLGRREDWTDFRSIEGLTRKAGVPKGRLQALILKELVDNALDSGPGCRFDQLEGRPGFYVEDEAGGIPGDDAAVAGLFALNRPRLSSKLLRMPTRGALGNGLRVVAGAVLASGGSLTVHTNGRSLRVTPRDDGGADFQRLGEWEGKGTRLEVTLGPPLLLNKVDPFGWVQFAQSLAGGAQYAGKSSPYWYTSESFFELLKSYGPTPVRDLVASLDGCSRKAGEITAGFQARPADSLSRAEADDVLGAARRASGAVRHERLGWVGRLGEFPGYSGRMKGTFKMPTGQGRFHADVPFVVEAWARPADAPKITLCVNRTPVTGDVRVTRDAKEKTEYVVFGCNLGYRFRVGRHRDFTLLVNVLSPAVGMTTDGKEPDLEPLADEIVAALEKAARVAARAAPKAQAGNQKAFVRHHLDEVLGEAGAGGRRFSLRHLFYAFRPRLIDFLGKEPSYKTFSNIIAELEEERGEDLPGMYRDTRGVIYHPHLRQWVTLGTLSAEAYRRPEWAFNKVLYCEKEGLFPILIDARFPERFDCALMTAKGFATRAARDVLDLLGESSEPLLVFCIHDADAHGTMIYQCLQEATVARPARRVTVVNLGLEVAEARRMGLQPEAVKRKKKGRAPVAGYVAAEDAEWLQHNRYELNAMSADQFLRWLEEKMGPYQRKVIPPEPVMRLRLQGEVRVRLGDAMRERILREAGYERRLDEAVARRQAAVESRSGQMPEEVRSALAERPSSSWSEAVGLVADDLVKGV